MPRIGIKIDKSVSDGSGEVGPKRPQGAARSRLDIESNNVYCQGFFNEDTVDMVGYNLIVDEKDNKCDWRRAGRNGSGMASR